MNEEEKEQKRIAKQQLQEELEAKIADGEVSVFGVRSELLTIDMMDAAVGFDGMQIAGMKKLFKKLPVSFEERIKFGANNVREALYYTYMPILCFRAVENNPNAIALVPFDDLYNKYYPTDITPEILAEEAIEKDPHSIALVGVALPQHVYDKAIDLGCELGEIPPFARTWENCTLAYGIGYEFLDEGSERSNLKVDKETKPEYVNFKLIPNAIKTREFCLQMAYWLGEYHQNMIGRSEDLTEKVLKTAPLDFVDDMRAIIYLDLYGVARACRSEEEAKLAIVNNIAKLAGRDVRGKTNRQQFSVDVNSNYLYLAKQFAKRNNKYPEHFIDLAREIDQDFDIALAQQEVAKEAYGK